MYITVSVFKEVIDDRIRRKTHILEEGCPISIFAKVHLHTKLNKMGQFYPEIGN